MFLGSYYRCCCRRCLFVSYCHCSFRPSCLCCGCYKLKIKNKNKKTVKTNWRGSIYKMVENINRPTPSSPVQSNIDQITLNLKDTMYSQEKKHFLKSCQCEIGSTSRSRMDRRKKSNSVNEEVQEEVERRATGIKWIIHLTLFRNLCVRVSFKKIQ